MLTRPRQLSDEMLVYALGTGWGIKPATIEYRAVGYGSHHWYVTEAHEARWMVTVDDLAGRLRCCDDSLEAAYGRLRSALLTARALHEAGASFAVAPVRTASGDVLSRVGEYAIALYPYVDGHPGEFGDSLSVADRRAMLALIVAVHAAPDSVRRSASTDDFRLPGGDALGRALDDAAIGWGSGPYGEPARLLLARHGDDVKRLLERRDQLADKARGRPDRMVLTHGEPHPGNFIQDGPRWRLIDWDTTLIAPPERDLWSLDPGDGSITSAYRQLTDRDVLPSMLDLYRLTWRLSDVASCIARFRQEHADTEEDRKDWEILSSTRFAPSP
jgi:aminoglycoside phosphotransferase (APT) family kinase protein